MSEPEGLGAGMRMRRVKNYEVGCDKFESPTITYRDRTGMHVVVLNAGGLWNVEIEVFRENRYTYVLSWNDRHPYVGLERFLGQHRRGDLSFGKREAIEEVLGKRPFELTPITMAKRLARYLGKPGGPPSIK